MESFDGIKGSTLQAWLHVFDFVLVDDVKMDPIFFFLTHDLIVQYKKQISIIVYCKHGTLQK